MNYKKIYHQLIESRSILERSKKDGYFERHHIIPKCIGGSNNKENLILLTPKEHFIAHLLLVNMFDGKIKSKMSYALLLMCASNGNQQRDFGSRRYEYAKKIVSQNCRGENASFYGRNLSESVIEMLSERMTGSNNPSTKYGTWNKGLKTGPLCEETKRKISEKLQGHSVSEETRLKISESKKGVPKTDDHKKKLSDFNTGKKLSDETKLRMSNSRKGKSQKLIKCPHCEKEGGTAMYRWHFDKCKSKF